MAKTDQNTAKSKSKATKPKTVVRSAKKPKTSTVKVGRKSDGTFAPGNSFGKNSGGRPPEDMSFRAQVKLRAAKNPKMVQNAIDTLVAIANNPDHPKCVEAIDKLIKLNGNYDPQETKDVTPQKQERIYKGLSLAQINKLLGDDK